MNHNRTLALKLQIEYLFLDVAIACHRRASWIQQLGNTKGIIGSCTPILTFGAGTVYQ
jgi:hypothetical protein